MRRYTRDTKNRTAPGRRFAAFANAVCLPLFLAIWIATFPAHAGMVELKVKPPEPNQNGSDQSTENPSTSTSKTSDPETRNAASNGGDQPVKADKASQEVIEPASEEVYLATCSRNYHQALSRLLASDWEELNAAWKAAYERDKSLPGRMLFQIPKAAKTDEIRNAMTAASRTARYRGRDPWLAKEGPGWLIRQFVTDLKTYYTQPYNEYLCSGTRQYLAFLKPHAAKLSRAAAATTVLPDEMLAETIKSIFEANDLLRPVPIPEFATNRPVSGRDANNLSNDIDLPPLRSTIAPQDDAGDPLTGDTTDVAETITGSTGTHILDDPDLPLLSTTTVIKGGEPEWIVQKLSELKEQANLSGWITYASSTDQPSGRTDEGQPEENGINLAIQHLQDWAIAYKTASPQMDPTVRAALANALSNLEVLFYLQPGSNRLVRLDKALQQNFSAIATAHKANCNCPGIDPVE